MQLVSVIVPAYNEVGRIEGTLGEIFGYFAGRSTAVEIIVVADGDDGTAVLVERMAAGEPRLRAIAHSGRRGKGVAVREGVAAARGDIVGFVDADDKTPISEFDKFVPLLTGPNRFDVVIGSRAMRDSRVERRQPWYRRLGSTMFAVAMHAVVGLDAIVDTQCGFKFFQRDVAADLFGRQRIDGYMFDVEILALASQSGYRVAQVPVRWRDDHDSRLQLVRGNVRNGMDLLRIGLGRFRARPTKRT